MFVEAVNGSGLLPGPQFPHLYAVRVVIPAAFQALSLSDRLGFVTCCVSAPVPLYVFRPDAVLTSRVGHCPEPVFPVMTN